MKLIKIFILFLAALSVGFGSYPQEVLADSDEMQVLALSDNRPSIVVCHEPGVIKAVKIFAVIIVVIKVMVPIMLIVTGIMNLGKAVVYEDDNALKKSAQLLLTKFIVGAFIFFIPTIIYSLMEGVHNYDKSTSQFTDCGKCLTSIKTCDQLIKKYS
ncbi:MAG: hypothetical protein E7164_00985 [Firmicutes bacterium]|nr:hypothetical protein [Bacillota bacterium]